MNQANIIQNKKKHGSNHEPTLMKLLSKKEIEMVQMKQTCEVMDSWNL